MSDERKYYEPFFKAPSNMYYYNIKRLFSMYGQQKLYRVDNMWINPYGKYGEYACVQTPDFIATLPHHLINKMKRIMDSEKCQSAVNTGHFFFCIYEYDAGTFGKQYSVSFLTLSDKEIMENA